MNPNQFLMDNMFQADPATLAGIFRPGEVHVSQEEVARRIAARNAAMRKREVGAQTGPGGTPSRDAQAKKEAATSIALLSEKMRNTPTGSSQPITADDSGDQPGGAPKLSPWARQRRSVAEANAAARDADLARRGLRFVPGTGVVPEFQWRAMEERARMESDDRAYDQLLKRQEAERYRQDYDRRIAREDELYAREREDRLRQQDKEMKESAKQSAAPMSIEDMVRKVMSQMSGEVRSADEVEAEVRRQLRSRSVQARSALAKMGDAQPALVRDVGTPYGEMSRVAKVDEISSMLR